MSRKARIPFKAIHNTNETKQKNNAPRCNKKLIFASEIKKIIVYIQNDLTSQQQYIRKIRELYTKVDHAEFIKVIISILMFFMQQPQDNSNANNVLLFLCKFLASYKNDENENPCRSIFNFVLSTDGANPHIRFRLCELVNILLVSLGDASLDEEICNQILKYMLNRLKNSSPHVRAQAIYALERLQVPEDPDDVVINYFIYHMQADPSAQVREAVITKIARNTKTISIIIERLRDSEERVRRHTYIVMMKGFSVKSYSIEQRLTFLENGLTDESLSIQKLVAHLMIAEWLISYNDNYIQFLRALKLNGSDEELQRYHNTAKYMLRQIFKKTKLEKLLIALVCNKENEEPNLGQLQVSVPIEHLTLEHSIFWVNLSEYIYKEKINDIDLLLPDLTTYCDYIMSYYNFKSNADIPFNEWNKLEFGYILTNLLNNLKYFDYSDEIGKKNLKDFICCILKICELNDHSLKTLLAIMETIIPGTIDRFSILNDVINDMYAPENFEFVSDRPLMQSILQKSDNSDILLTVSYLKYNILDLKAQIANFLTKKEYENVEKATEQSNNMKLDYYKELKPFLKFLPEQEANSILQAIGKTPPNTILKCLKIIFFMLSSSGVVALTPTITPIYSDFIRRFTKSNQIDQRKWALKCGTTFALLHEQFAQDMFVLLGKQFLEKPITTIWSVSIRGIFEILVRYELKHLNVVDWNSSQVSSSNRNHQLYRRTHNFLQNETDDSIQEEYSHVSLFKFMLHLLDTCTDDIIYNTIIEGFCLLCLNIKDLYPKIMVKLMTTYFDPATESKTNQLLGIFFKKLIVLGRSFLLEAALLPTIHTILDAGYESTLGDVNPKNVIRFVINATKSKYCHNELNIHEIIAESFLKEIQENINTKFRLVNVLSSELIRLNVNNMNENKSKFSKMVDEIFIDFSGAEKIKQNLINFQKLINGELNPETIVEISKNQSGSQSTDTIPMLFNEHNFSRYYKEHEDENDNNIVKQINAYVQGEKLVGELLEPQVAKRQKIAIV